jgi:hypothetical protein
MDISFIALTVLFVLTQLFHKQQQNQWAKERKDLYDRIMSKDIKEYKDNTAQPVVYEPVDNTEEAEWEREQIERKR